MGTIKYYLSAAAIGILLALPQSSTANAGTVGLGSAKQNVTGPGLREYGMQISHRSRYRRTIRVTGVITNEGVECTALRGDDGRLYTLAGRFRDLTPGERVRVIGRVAQYSFCMQGTTIQPRRIFAAR
jgi:hypothetical protein